MDGKHLVQWNENPNKADFKVIEHYIQDNGVFTAIIEGPNTKDYGNDVDKSIDKKFYFGIFSSQTLINANRYYPDTRSYSITTITRTGYYTFKVEIKDSSNNCFAGIICSLKTETLTNFLALIIMNKQLSSARERELDKIRVLIKTAEVDKNKN